MTDQNSSLTNDADEARVRSDADLVLRSRSGEAGAYAELWRRHYGSGIAVAQSITSSFDADDLVQEAFARIYQAIQKGGGPTGSFRAYLFTSIRNTAAGWGRSRREAPIDELDTVADPASTEQAADEALDQSLSAQAFRSLPSRWQEVLWYSEIEQMKPAEIAPLLGMTTGATSQLAFRAREGLREAWIQAHLRTAEPGSLCEWTIERLGAFARGNLGSRDRGKLEAHLGQCARCLIVAAEAKEVSQRLALVLLPLVLGIGGSGAYLAMLQSGTAPVVALAAMPSSVVQGAVVVGSGAVGAGAAGSGAAGSGAAGSGGASTSGGIVAGFGALVGAGSVALVVAGAIVAAAVVPGLTADPASTSAPSASDKSDSSIVAQVSPPVIAPVPPPAAPATPVTPPAPHEDAPKPPDANSTPVAEVPPATGTPAGNTVPVPPPATSTPAEPGTPDPGPGTTDPGPTDPGPTDPGPTDPGPTTPPASAPVVGHATLECGVLSVFTGFRVTIPITGVPGATVRASIAQGATQAATTVLDSSGAGAVELYPRRGQINGGAIVTLVYTVGDQLGGSSTFDLGTLGPVNWVECVIGSAPAPTPEPTPAAPAPTPSPATAPAVSTPVPESAPAAVDPATAPTAPVPPAVAPSSAPAPTAPDPAVPAPAAPVEPAEAPAPGA